MTRKLSEYKAKRRFDSTPEPQPKVRRSKNSTLKFCVQRHRARRLHYDLRLELDGVLLSWAVPKGPSMDPREKRLAIKVEDHPLDYLTFEGTIAQGNYGAGFVELWDIGTYSAPIAHMREGLNLGHLHFVLHGKRLNGSFVLVKLKDDNQWLLRKVEDDAQFLLKGHKKSPMLTSTKPMLAMVTDEPFDSPDWLFEIKWDGFRALAFVNGKNVKLVSRNHNLLNADYPSLVEELKSINKKVVLDGEIVVFDESGRPRFELLQGCAKDPECAPQFMAFDVLYINGIDVRNLALVDRKNLLKDFLDQLNLRCVHYTDHINDHGIKPFKEAAKMGFEGLIAKRKNSPYVSLRSRDWLKIKAARRDEFVIIGFTKPKGWRAHFGSLLLGRFDDGVLQFAGHVGTGFDSAMIEDVFAQLKPLITTSSPLKQPVKTNTKPTWVKPKLIADVSFAEQTTKGVLRQPVFHGLRTDKKIAEMKAEITSTVTFRHSFISNADKIFWPNEGYTKGDMLAYYETIAPIILPHLKDRPLTMRRYPDGIMGADFYQKDIPHAPAWLKTVVVLHSHGKKKEGLQACANDVRSLLYIANLGSIEMHPMLARAPHLDLPDSLVIDLDPEATIFADVVDVALFAHELLDKVGLPNYCKTSGRRGLHIYVPLNQQLAFKESLHLAELIALIIRDHFPKLVSLERSPQKRQKKVYVDFLQNGRGKTTVGPYSLRALAHAPVSTPLAWKEVKRDLDPLAFTITTVPKRVKKLGDIFAELLNTRIDLAKSLAKIEELL